MGYAGWGAAGAMLARLSFAEQFMKAVIHPDSRRSQVNPANLIQMKPLVMPKLFHCGCGLANEDES